MRMTPSTRRHRLRPRHLQIRGFKSHRMTSMITFTESWTERKNQQKPAVNLGPLKFFVCFVCKRNYWQKLTWRILSWMEQNMRQKVQIVWWLKFCWWATVIQVWRTGCNFCVFRQKPWCRVILRIFHKIGFIIHKIYFHSTLVQAIKSRFTGNKVHSYCFDILSTCFMFEFSWIIVKYQVSCLSQPLLNINYLALIWMWMFDYLKLIQNGRLNSLLYIRLTTAAGVEVKKLRNKNNKQKNNSSANKHFENWICPERRINLLLLQKSGHIDLADRVANQVECPFWSVSSLINITPSTCFESFRLSDASCSEGWIFHCRLCLSH